MPRPVRAREQRGAQPDLERSARLTLPMRVSLLASSLMRWSGPAKQHRPRLDYARMLELGATTCRLELGNGGDEHAATWEWDWQRAGCSSGPAGSTPARRRSGQQRAGRSLGAVARAPQLEPAASVPQLGLVGHSAAAAAWRRDAGAAPRAGGERATARRRRGAQVQGRCGHNKGHGGANSEDPKSRGSSIIGRQNNSEMQRAQELFY